MFDILTALYYNELDGLPGKSAFAEPCTIAERTVLTQLKTLDGETAEALKSSIYTLVQEGTATAFCSGLRFGAQLMAQLLQDV